MCDPRFHPVQDAGQRSDHRQADQDVGERIAVAHRAHDQGGQNADADERRDAHDAEAKGRDQARPPRPHQLHQHAEQAEPTEPIGADDTFRWGCGFLRLARFGRRNRGQVLENQFRRLVLGLRRHETLIKPARPHQFGMAASFGHAALVHHQDAVGADDARQAMGEDQRGAPDHETVEGLLNHLFVLSVDRGQGLIQD